MMNDGYGTASVKPRCCYSRCVMPTVLRQRTARRAALECERQVISLLSRNRQAVVGRAVVGPRSATRESQRLSGRARLGDTCGLTYEGECHRKGGVSQVATEGEGCRTGCLACALISRAQLPRRRLSPLALLAANQAECTAALPSECSRRVAKLASRVEGTEWRQDACGPITYRGSAAVR